MKIIYTRADGGLSVVHCAPKEDLEKVLGPLTDEAWRDHVWKKSIPADAVNAMEIPDDFKFPEREFRDAWMQNGKEIAHDLAKAKDIQLGRLRAERELKFASADKDFMLALESGDDAAKANAVARKEALRSCTDKLKALDAKSIEDIKSATPSLEGL